MEGICTGVGGQRRGQQQRGRRRRRGRQGRAEDAKRKVAGPPHVTPSCDKRLQITYILDTRLVRLLSPPPPPPGRPSRACWRRRPCRNEPCRLQLRKHVPRNVCRVVLRRDCHSMLPTPPRTPRSSPNRVSTPQLIQQRVQHILILHRLCFLRPLPLSTVVLQ